MDIGSNPAPVIVGSFPTPNVVTDKLMHLLTPQENMVLQFMCRHILGFGDTRERRKKRISLSVFTDGFTCIKDTGEVDHYFGTGLCLSAVRNALKALAQYRVIEKCTRPDGTADVDNNGQLWAMPFDNIDIDGLQQRFEAKSSKHVKRTTNASAKRRGVSSDVTPIVGQQEGGIVPHKEGGIVGRQHTKQVTKQVEKDLPAVAGEGQGIARKAIARKPSTPKKPRDRDPLFDAIVVHLLEIDLTDARKVKAVGGRVGMLIKNFPAEPESVTPERIEQFAKWWKLTRDGLTPPQGAASLAKPWSEFEKMTAGRQLYQAQQTAFPVERIAPVLMDGKTGMHQTLPDTVYDQLRPSWKVPR